MPKSHQFIRLCIFVRISVLNYKITGLTVPIGGRRKPSPHFLLINHCVFLTEGFLQRKESSRQKTSYCTFSNISLSTKSKLNSNLGIPKISISFSVIFLAA